MTAGETDVLIVGSGFGAAAVARALAGSGARVTILEAGPAWSSPPGSHLRNLAGLATDPAAWRSLASGLLVRPVRPAGPAVPGLAPATAAARVHVAQGRDDGLPGLGVCAAVGGSGLVWSGVVLPPASPCAGLDHAALEEARGWLGASPVHGSPRQDLLAAQHGLEPVPLAFGPAGRWRGPADVAGDEPEIRAETAAYELALDGSRVVGVMLRDGRIFRAQHVVLAAGVVGTVRLLAASRLAPGLPGLGRGIADHPVVFGQCGLGGARWDELLASGPAAALPAALRAPPEPGHHVLVIAEEPRLVADRVHPDAVLSIYAYATAVRAPEHRVEFPGPLGPDGLALPLFTCPTTADTQRGRAAALAIARRWIERLGVALPGAQPRALAAGAAQHLACGASVGAPGDELAVADLEGRVRETSNLWVAGAAALPSPVSTHPVQSIVALGARTGRAIRRG